MDSRITETHETSLYHEQFFNRTPRSAGILSRFGFFLHKVMLNRLPFPSRTNRYGPNVLKVEVRLCVPYSFIERFQIFPQDGRKRNYPSSFEQSKGPEILPLTCVGRCRSWILRLSVPPVFIFESSIMSTNASIFLAAGFRNLPV